MARYEAGHNTPGPGRPVGSLSGRAQAVAVLDKVFSKEANKRKLEKALQAEFDKAPATFFRRFGYLIPREILSRLEMVNTSGEEEVITVEIVPRTQDVRKVEAAP